MLTRVRGARDLGTGLELKAETLGKLSSLQVHHIFPKAVLYDVGYERGTVNAVANFCFLTQETNLAIGRRDPAEYLAEVESKYPGALASQWIPTDPELWRPERYGDFLEARRELLAQAAQEFLTELRTGDVATTGTNDLQPLTVTTDDVDDARVAQVHDVVDELRRMGYGVPTLDAEIVDPVNGRSLAMAEAFWPDGLQAGQGNPVVLELDTDAADLPRLEELGYEVFTSVDALLGYANRRNESAAGVVEPATPPGPVPSSEPSESVSVAASPHTEAEFASRMRDIYDRGRREANYTASYFLSMLADLGPVPTARKLLSAPAVSDGFAALWERGRLDLTVEALVLESQFAELFEDRELANARRRLDQFGFTRA